MNIYKHNCQFDTPIKFLSCNSAEDLIGTVSGITLPSPELIYLLDIGCSFKLQYGSWGVKTFDFEFPKFMYKKDENNIPFYSKIVGNWHGLSTTNTIQRW